MQKSGETPKARGEYLLVGPRGGKVPNPIQITIDGSERHLPPTPKPNQNWERLK